MIFFNLGISFKDIELRYGRAKKRDFFSNVSTKQVTSNVVYKFHWGLSNNSYYCKCVRHLNMKMGKHDDVSRLTKI